tara:strand:- start:214 stop:441 length:228 start_codon:yes stop_codon:yes gene_type:complete
MLEIVRQKYGMHVDTRVYLDLGYGEMEIDVEDIEMVDGELSAMAYCHQREIEMYAGHKDCERALAKYEEENSNDD